MQGHDTERIKIDDNIWQCECVQCGGSFESKRSDASFCSPACRTAYSREPLKRLQAIEALLNAGKTAVKTSKKYKYDDEVFEVMLGLRKTIEYALAQFEKKP